MVRRSSLTVRDLANEAGVDLDETLVTLWEVGLEQLLNASDVIQPPDIGRARAALSIAGRSVLRSIEYWVALLDENPQGIRTLLRQNGITMGRHAKRIPSGGVSRLKATARRLGINPLTGTPQQAVQRKDQSQEEAREEPKGEHLPAPLVVPGRPVAYESFTWVAHGRELIQRWLTPDEVVGIHYALVADFDGSKDPIRPAGLRSEHLLASAVSRPLTSLGEVLKYGTIESAAAALLHSLILNHPFHNGNKRTALVAALVFLDENGVVPTCDEDEVFRLVLQISQHRVIDPVPDQMADREVFAIAHWLHGRTRLVRKGENPLPWRRLRQQLAAYGCECEFSGGVGNRISIVRRVERVGRFGRKRLEVLQTQVFYGGPGREADVSTITKIRKDLELDDTHGVDSHDFYAKEPTTIAEFIATYRKTLNRLASL